MQTQNYIQYDRSKKDYATQNRKNLTPTEQIIREKILRKKQTWHTFLRQKMLWPFIADFYCSKLLLVIEIDGKIHNKQKIEDAKRTEYINDLWIMVIRYTNEQILNQLEKIKQDITTKLKNREQHI